MKESPGVVAGLDSRQASHILRSLLHVELEEVLSLVGYLREPDDFTAITGSVAVGLGNAKSDLDVMVVGQQHEHSAALPLTNFAGDVRVDVWKLDRGRLERLAARAQAAVKEQQAVGPAFTQSDIRILQRLAFGLIIDGLPSMALTGDGAKALVCTLCRQYFAEIARKTALASHLAASMEDWLTATWNARHCLDSACESRLARDGRPFIGDKWLYHRVRASSERWWDEIARLTVLPDGFAPGESAVYAGECFDLAEQYLGEPLGYDAVAAELAWVAHSLERQDLGSKHLLLDTKQYRLVELSNAERAWWEESFSADRKQHRTRIVADTPGTLTFLTALWRNSLIDVEQASEGTARC